MLNNSKRTKPRHRSPSRGQKRQMPVNHCVMFPPLLATTFREAQSPKILPRRGTDNPQTALNLSHKCQLRRALVAWRCRAYAERVMTRVCRLGLGMASGSSRGIVEIALVGWISMSQQNLKQALSHSRGTGQKGGSRRERPPAALDLTNMHPTTPTPHVHGGSRTNLARPRRGSHSLISLLCPRQLVVGRGRIDLVLDESNELYTYPRSALPLTSMSNHP